MRMHADEVDTGPAVVRRLLAAQFPRWASLPLVPVESAGTQHAVYRLGDELAVRLPRLEAAAGDVAREQRWLPRLAPALPVPIPEPVAQGAPGEGYGWPWSVVRWVPGTHPRVGDLPDPHRLSRDLARFVAALRAVDPAGGPACGRGRPLSTRDEPTRAALRALRGVVDVDAAGAAWDEALRLRLAPEPPRWLHGDLSPFNLLVDGGRLAGVIDFGAAGVGDPAVDLIVAWNLLPAAARPTFRSALQVDDLRWRAGRAWALSIALVQLPYYRDRNPALAANAAHTVAEIVAELAEERSPAPGG